MSVTIGALIYAIDNWAIHANTDLFLREFHDAGGNINNFAEDNGQTKYPADYAIEYYEEAVAEGRSSRALDSLGQAILYFIAESASCAVQVQGGTCRQPTGLDTLARIVVESPRGGGEKDGVTGETHSIRSSLVAAASYLENGAYVDPAATVNFIAKPASGSYLSEWTGDCAGEPAGDADSLGAEITCSNKTAGTGLTVGGIFITPRFVATFAGVSLFVNGVTTAMLNSTEMEYRGERRGLRFIVQKTGDLPETDAEALCNDAGEAHSGLQWRRPSLAELIGLYSNTEAPITVAAYAPATIPGAAESFRQAPARPLREGDAPSLDPATPYFPGVYGTDGALYALAASESAGIIESVSFQTGNAAAICVVPAEATYGGIDDLVGVSLTPADDLDAGRFIGIANILTVTARIQGADTNGPVAAPTQPVFAQMSHSPNTLNIGNFLTLIAPESGLGEITATLRLTRRLSQSEINAAAGTLALVATIRASGASGASAQIAATIALSREDWESQIYAQLNNATVAPAFPVPDPDLIRANMEGGADPYAVVNGATIYFLPFAAAQAAADTLRDGEFWAEIIEIIASNGAHPNHGHQGKNLPDIITAVTLASRIPAMEQIFRAYLNAASPLPDLLSALRGLEAPDSRSPLDSLAANPACVSSAPPAVLAACREISSLLYERNAPCVAAANQNNPICRLQTHIVPPIEGLEYARTGEILRFAPPQTGAATLQFLQIPEAAAAPLRLSGWTWNIQNNPPLFVLSRGREYRQGDSNFNLPLPLKTQNANPARQYRVNAAFPPGGPVYIIINDADGNSAIAQSGGNDLVNALTANFQIIRSSIVQTRVNPANGAVEQFQVTIQTTIFADPQVILPGGALVTVRAKPSPRHYVQQWGGICSGQNTQTSRADSQFFTATKGVPDNARAGEEHTCLIRNGNGISVSISFIRSDIGPPVRSFANGTIAQTRLNTPAQNFILGAQTDNGHQQTRDYLQYFGERRGLHWLISQQPPETSALTVTVNGRVIELAAATGGSITLRSEDPLCTSAICQKHAEAMCERAGNNWRPARLQEVAGLMQESGNTFTFPSGESGSAADPYPQWNWNPDVNSRTLPLHPLEANEVSVYMDGNLIFASPNSRFGFGGVAPLVSDLPGHVVLAADLTGTARTVYDSITSPFGASTDPIQAAVQQALLAWIGGDNNYWENYLADPAVAAGVSTVTPHAACDQGDIKVSNVQGYIECVFNTVPQLPPPGVEYNALMEGRPACVSPSGFYDDENHDRDWIALESAVLSEDGQYRPAQRAEIFANNENYALAAITARIRPWQYNDNGETEVLNTPLNVGALQGALGAANFATDIASLPGGGYRVIIRQISDYAPVSPVSLRVEASPSANFGRTLTLNIVVKPQPLFYFGGNGIRERGDIASFEVANILGEGSARAEMEYRGVRRGLQVMAMRRAFLSTLAVNGLPDGYQDQICSSALHQTAAGSPQAWRSPNLGELMGLIEGGDSQRRIIMDSVRSRSQSPVSPDIPGLFPGATVRLGPAVNVATENTQGLSASVGWFADVNYYDAPVAFNGNRSNRSLPIHKTLRDGVYRASVATRVAPSDDSVQFFAVEDPPNTPPGWYVYTDTRMTTNSRPSRYARFPGGTAISVSVDSANCELIGSEEIETGVNRNVYSCPASTECWGPNGADATSNEHGCPADPGQIYDYAPDPAATGRAVCVREANPGSYTAPAPLAQGEAFSAQVAENAANGIPVVADAAAAQVASFELRTRRYGRNIGAVPRGEIIQTGGVADVRTFSIGGFTGTRNGNTYILSAPSELPDPGDYLVEIEARAQSGGWGSTKLTVRVVAQLANFSVSLVSAQNGNLDARVTEGGVSRALPNGQTAREFGLVEVSARPNPDHYVSGWTNDCANEDDVLANPVGAANDLTDKTCRFYLTKDVTVGATFATVDYSAAYAREFRRIADVENDDLSGLNLDLIEFYLDQGAPIDTPVVGSQHALNYLLGYPGATSETARTYLHKQTGDTIRRLFEILLSRGHTFDAATYRSIVVGNNPALRLLYAEDPHPARTDKFYRLTEGMIAGMREGRPDVNLRAALNPTGSLFNYFLMDEIIQIHQVLDPTGNNLSSAPNPNCIDPNGFCARLIRLMHEYGGQCGALDSNTFDLCKTPQIRLAAAIEADETGQVLEIRGREKEMDTYEYRIPAADIPAGWTVVIYDAARPHRAIVSRTATGNSSGQLTIRQVYRNAVGIEYVVDLLAGTDNATVLASLIYDHVDPNSQDIDPEYVNELLRLGADPNYERGGTVIMARAWGQSNDTLYGGGSFRNGAGPETTYEKRGQIAAALIDAGASADVRIANDNKSEGVQIHEAMMLGSQGFDRFGMANALEAYTDALLRNPDALAQVDFSEFVTFGSHEITPLVQNGLTSNCGPAPSSFSYDGGDPGTEDEQRNACPESSTASKTWE